MYSWVLPSGGGPMTQPPDESGPDDLPVTISERYQRLNAVILRLPGLDDDTYRLNTQTDTIALGGVVDDLLAINKIERVEILLFPGESGIVTVLDVQVNKTPTERLSRGDNKRYNSLPTRILQYR